MKLVGFKDIELEKFEGSSLSKDAMNEWREMMPKIINKVEDKDRKIAFQKATKKIWETYEKQGGVFSSYYVMRMRK